MRAALMIAVLAVAVPDRPERYPNQTRPLQEQLQGEWEVVSSIVGGEPQDPSTLGGVYEFRGNRLVTRVPRLSEPVAYELILDTTRMPAFIDFISGSAGNKSTFPGILKIEGDTLTLCTVRVAGVPRPTEFALTTDDLLYELHQLKRIGK